MIWFLSKTGNDLIEYNVRNKETQYLETFLKPVEGARPKDQNLGKGTAIKGSHSTNLRRYTAQTHSIHGSALILTSYMLLTGLLEE